MRTVALLWDDADEFGSTQFTDFDAPVLNEQGRIAFRGEHGSSGPAIWSDGAGNGLKLVAERWTPFPERASGEYFESFESPQIDETGRVLFIARLGGLVDALSDEGVWRTDAEGQLTEVIREGRQAAGLSGDTSIALSRSRIAMNRRGGIAVAGYTVGDVTGEGVWAEQANGELALIAHQSSPPDSLPAGTEYDIIGSPSIDASNQVAFVSSLRHPGSSAFEHAIWESGPSGASRLAGDGDIARNGDELDIYGSDPPVFNGRTTVVSGQANRDAGLWWKHGSGLDLLAKEGVHAHGRPPDETYFDLYSRPRANQAGQAAYLFGTLRRQGLGEPSLRHEGIWVSTPGEAPQLAWHSTDPVPGVPEAEFGFFGDTFMFALNDKGLVAFAAPLKFEDRPYYSTEADGIWAQAPGGELTLIVRRGDSIDVDDDPSITSLREVVRLHFLDGSLGQTTQAMGFNNRGEVAFVADFEDGSSGVFISTAAARLDADFDANGVIDESDYDQWVATYGTSVPAGLGADGNRDGVIDAADYVLWRDAYSAGVAVGVPEPGCAAGAAIAAAIGVTGYRRFRL